MSSISKTLQTTPQLSTWINSSIGKIKNKKCFFLGGELSAKHFLYCLSMKDENFIEANRILLNCFVNSSWTKYDNTEELMSAPLFWLSGITVIHYAKSPTFQVNS